jgi:hypothetical protein
VAQGGASNAVSSADLVQGSIARQSVALVEDDGGEAELSP